MFIGIIAAAAAFMIAKTFNGLYHRYFLNRSLWPSVQPHLVGQIPVVILRHSPCTAILKFLSAAARTWIISLRNCRSYNLIFLVSYPVHHIGRSSFVFQLLCHEFHIWLNMMKKQFVTLHTDSSVRAYHQE